MSVILTTCVVCTPPLLLPKDSEPLIPGVLRSVWSRGLAVLAMAALGLELSMAEHEDVAQAPLGGWRARAKQKKKGSRLKYTQVMFVFQHRCIANPVTVLENARALFASSWYS